MNRARAKTKECDLALMYYLTSVMDKDIIITSLYHDPFELRRRLRRLSSNGAK